jgi:hypothetical protein
MLRSNKHAANHPRMPEDLALSGPVCALNVVSAVMG